MLEAIPYAAAIFLCYALSVFVFKKQLANRLGKLTKVSKEGIEMESASDSPQVTSQSKWTSEVLHTDFDNPILVKYMTRLKEHATERYGELTIDLLLRIAADSLLLHQFEKINNLIFGSQLSALQKANSSAQTNEQLRHFYDDASAVYADFYSGFSFEAWLSFFSSYSLLEFKGGKFYITLEGRQFLRYVVEKGYEFDRKG